MASKQAAAAQAPAAIGWAGRAFFGGLCAGTFGLGTWQTLRCREKVALLQQRERDLRLPPVVASSDNRDPTASLGFRRLVLKGRFRHDRELLVGPRGPPKGALPDGPGTSGAGLAAAPQGFLVVTPLVLRPPSSSPQQERREQTSDNDNNNDDSNTALVNRGWVPMQQVLGSSSSSPQQQRRRAGAAAGAGQSAKDPDLMKWDRPAGDVTVTVVPGKFEQPKFLIAQHNLDETPPKLFWFDRSAMLQLGGMAESDTQDAAAAAAAAATKLDLATQVQDDEDDEDVDATTATTGEWPVRPTAADASAFKISPAVHAGYAFTWYSLSAAGLYMTRKLVTRGR